MRCASACVNLQQRKTSVRLEQFSLPADYGNLATRQNASVQCTSRERRLITVLRYR